MKKLPLEKFNKKWVYEADKIDGWSVTNRGDCDDYALTVAWIVSDHSWIKFWFNVFFFRVLFYHVYTGTEDHIVLKYKGQFIDNINMSWRDDHGYKAKFPYLWLPPFVVLKVIFGKLFN